MISINGSPGAAIRPELRRVIERHVSDADLEALVHDLDLRIRSASDVHEAIEEVLMRLGEVEGISVVIWPDR